MSFETTSALKLPEIYLGCQRIRYLYLARSGDVSIPRSDDLLSGKQTEDDLIPLFLAADVLAGIAQMPKNYPRIHSRYSKQGLATKIKLQGHRITEIANGQEIWFYSIQGLFQAVFEYHSRPVIRDCLMALRELWVRRFEDEWLVVDTELRQVLQGPAQEELPVSGEVSVEGLGHSPWELTSDTTGACQYQGLPVEPNTRPQHLSGEMMTDSVRYTEQDVQQQLKHILHNVFEILEQHTASSESIDRLEALKTTLCFCVFDLFRDSYSAETAFPVCLLRAYTRVVCGQSDQKVGDFENHFDINCRKNAVLCILSEWIGKEFSKLEVKISEHVAMFKQSHIEQIDSLPTPQSIVNQLFPSCMSCLLENWMGVHRTRYIVDITDITAAGTHQSGLSDHNYIHCTEPPVNAPPICEDQEDGFKTQHFPFVQLILEFTNSCLISGVAHVLYSRLREGLI